MCNWSNCINFIKIKGGMMTDKRFTYSNTYGWNKDGFLKVMNGLDEKNKKLQKENEELKQSIHRLKQNIDELLSVNVEEELLKENEQLKSENNKLNERIGILEGSLMDKGFDIND